MNAYEAILEALIARATQRRRRRAFDLDVRRHGRLDGGAAVAAGGAASRRSASASRTPRSRPTARSDSRDGVDILICDPERPRMARAGRKGSRRCRARRRSGFRHQCRARQAPRRNRRQGRRRRSARSMRRSSSKSSPPPTSPLRASTRRPSSRVIRICAASPSARRAGRCPIRRRPQRDARRRAATVRCRRSASTPRKCARNSVATAEHGVSLSQPSRCVERGRLEGRSCSAEHFARGGHDDENERENAHGHRLYRSRQYGRAHGAPAGRGRAQGRRLRHAPGSDRQSRRAAAPSRRARRRKSPTRPKP